MKRNTIMLTNQEESYHNAPFILELVLHNRLCNKPVFIARVLCVSKHFRNMIYLLFHDPLWRHYLFYELTSFLIDKRVCKKAFPFRIVQSGDGLYVREMIPWYSKYIFV